jgi:hypothetical protein
MSPAWPAPPAGPPAPAEDPARSAAVHTPRRIAGRRGAPPRMPGRPARPPGGCRTPRSNLRPNCSDDRRQGIPWHAQRLSLPRIKAPIACADNFRRRPARDGPQNVVEIERQRASWRRKRDRARHARHPPRGRRARRLHAARPRDRRRGGRLPTRAEHDLPREALGVGEEDMATFASVPPPPRHARRPRDADSDELHTAPRHDGGLLVTAAPREQLPVLMARPDPGEVRHRLAPAI